MFWEKILHCVYKCLLLIILFASISTSKKEKCWSNFDAEKHFDTMDKLDERYAEVKRSFIDTVGSSQFDKDILVMMLQNRGKAERAIHAAYRDESVIPAGINLGGYCIVKMPKSLLFFHRMKLRNNTSFRVTDLKSNLADLTLKANILMNDLHLFGSYDFTNILSKRGILSYDPTFGQVELLLKNVSYNIEGRYRLLKNKLNIVLIISEIDLDGILMMLNRQSEYHFNSVFLDDKRMILWQASASNYMFSKLGFLLLIVSKRELYVLNEDGPGKYRLKVDLNKWLKDYFNDYLMYYVVAEDAKFEKYNQERTTALNQYADGAIDKVLERLNEIQAHAVQLPPFEIHTKNIAEIKLRDGVLRGLDSIYRRSITTGTKQNNIRSVDTIVGFSNLKLSYRYDVLLNSGLPPVTGVLTLTADDLTAHMQLLLTNNPATADLSFMFLEQAKPESLTVEGPGNRMISNFKYMLERHILAIMTNTLVHNIHMLGTLDRCVPIFAAYKENEAAVDVNINEDDENKQNLQDYKENKRNTETERLNIMYHDDTDNSDKLQLQNVIQNGSPSMDDEDNENEKSFSNSDNDYTNDHTAKSSYVESQEDILNGNLRKDELSTTSQKIQNDDNDNKNSDSEESENNKILIGYDTPENKNNQNNIRYRNDKKIPFDLSKKKQRKRVIKYTTRH